MASDVDFTPRAERWLGSLAPADRDRMTQRIDLLRRHGPALGRPPVDSINGSRHHKTKEPASPRGRLRALFAFRPDRSAMSLVGGDRSSVS